LKEVWKGRMSRWPSKDEDLHKRLHLKHEPVKYEPITVTDALHALNLYLKTIIELGTYSYLSGEETVARHIIELENTIDNTAYQLLIHASLTVGHNISKAMGSLPLYIYVLGVDKITDAFKDLAFLTLMGYRPSNELYRYYVFLSDVIRAKVPGSKLAGKTMGWIQEEYAVEPIAILRESAWILIPDEDEVVRPGDVVYFSGVKENVNDLLKSIGMEEITGMEPPPGIEAIMGHIDSMVDIVNLLNDLAHYQLKAQDPEMIEEVMEIEMFFDKLRLKVSEMIMDSNNLDSKDKFSLLMLVTRLEDVTDAFAYALTLPAKDEYKEVLSRMVEGSGEKVRLFYVASKVNIAKLADELEELGATVLAVKKQGDWIAITPYNIGKLVAEPGDALLIMYPIVLEEDLMDFMKRYSTESEEVGVEEEEEEE